MATYVRGLHGVNVSWDSGRLVPSDPEVDTAWSFQDGYAVTPEIGDKLIEHWPYSGEGFDEWYFFRVIPADLSLAPYCNWCGASVADWRDYAFNKDLHAQLARTRPELVIGEGHTIFVISQDERAITSFLGLAHEV